MADRKDNKLRICQTRQATCSHGQFTGPQANLQAKRCKLIIIYEKYVEKRWEGRDGMSSQNAYDEICGNLKIPQCELDF